MPSEVPQVRTPDEEHQIHLPFATSHAFIIGIDAYRHVSELSTAVNDARKLARVLTEDHGYQVHPPLLDATHAEIMHLLQEELPRLVGEEDRVFFYFAGHGIALDSDTDPRGYLVPADAEPGEPETLISMDLFHRSITELPCRHGILVLDCCFAGSFRWSSGFRDLVFDLPGIIYEERFYQYARDPAWQVITSSASDQKAVDVLSNRSLGMRNPEGAEHSPFARALIDGINGAADTIPKDREDGVITATELYTYLRDRVEDETTRHGKRQSPSMFSLSKHDKGQYIFLQPNHRLNLPPIPRRNPFMGLLAYEEKDSILFYGRDRVIEALTDLARQRQLIVVSGASGTGKSSLIKAGLIPRLRQEDWNILPIVRPGQVPLHNLRSQIPDLSARLRSDVPNLLVIDQYEELITQCLQLEERVAFEAQLAQWLLDYPTTLRIVISVRSDFEPHFESGALAGWWHVGHYSVPSFSPDELREVIVKPTVQEVLFFEPESLIDKLIDAVNQAPGALPLLSFTLSELYFAYLNSGRTNRAFTLEDYECLGGVIGALRTRADELYQQFDDAHRGSMRHLMLRMVSLEGGELASRRIPFRDLIATDPAETQRTRTVARLLVEARLVTTGRDQAGENYYEPGHDALVRAWARLWEWIKQTGEDRLGLMYKLSLAVTDYEVHHAVGQGKKYLWENDPRLDLLYVDLKGRDHGFNAREEHFLRQSMHLRRRLSRRRRTLEAATLAGLTLLTCLAILFGILMNSARKTASAAQMKAEKALERTKKMAELAYDNSAKAEKQEKIANLYAVAAQLKADTARWEREAARRQARLAEAATRRARRQASLAEAGRLANFATQLADKQHYTPALQKALDAYNVANAPRPPVTYQTFLHIFGGKQNREIPVVVATLDQHQPSQFNFLANGGGRAAPTHSVQAVFSPSGERVLSYTEGPVVRVWDRRGRLLSSLFGHSAAVTSAHFTADGRRILTTSIDHTVRIWAVEGQLLHKLDQHQGQVNSLHFAPDSLRFATISRDRTVKIWNLDGESLTTLMGHEGQVNSVRFSPDGDYFLTGSDDGTARLWNREGKVVLALQPDDGPVRAADFSPEGRYLLTRTDGMAKIWDRWGRTVSELSGHQGGLTTASFSPNGQYVLTGSLDGTAQLWDLWGNMLAGMNQHQGPVTGAIFTSDSLYILTWSADKTAKLWDYKGRLLADLVGHTGRLTTAFFIPQRQYIVTCAEDRTTKIWDRKGNLLANLDEHAAAVTNAAVSPDLHCLLTTSRDLTAKLWELRDNLLVNLRDQQTALTDVTFSPAGDFVLTSARNGRAKLWNRRGQVVTTFDHDAVQAAEFSPDGSRVLTRDGGRTARLWDLSGKLLTELREPRGDLLSAAFTPDGQSILTTATNHVARLWSLRGKALAKLVGHSDWIGGFDFSPDAPRILTYSADGTAKLWDRSGQLLADLDRHSGLLTSAAFSPDGHRILTSSADGTAKIWNSNGKLLADLKGHTQRLTMARFSPDGRWVATASADGTAKIWDSSGRPRADLSEHTQSVIQVDFSPDGRYLLTRSEDRTARVWTLDGELRATLALHKDDLTIARFSADSELILTASRDGTAKLWNTTGDLLADLNLHEQDVIEARFAPQGRSILTGSADGSAILWPLPDVMAEGVAKMVPDVRLAAETPVE